MATKEETSCFDREEEKVYLSLNDSPEVVIKNIEGAEEDTKPSTGLFLLCLVAELNVAFGVLL